MREDREHHIGDADQRRSDRHFPDRRPVMPCLGAPAPARDQKRRQREHEDRVQRLEPRSEEHTSDLQSLMRISYAVFCLKKKKRKGLKFTLHSQKSQICISVYMKFAHEHYNKNL